MAKVKKREEYGDDSIEMLKGADRVRKKPSVIFGSNGIEGCEHSVFEIISTPLTRRARASATRLPSPASRISP